jgi:hypothetical protein
MSYPQAVVVPRDLYYHEVAYVRGLEAALRDIAQGNVPPGFLDGIEGETKVHFQERLTTWLQQRARDAIIKANEVRT